MSGRQLTLKTTAPFFRSYESNHSWTRECENARSPAGRKRSTSCGTVRCSSASLAFSRSGSFAQELRDQLSRTIQVVNDEHFDFEVVIEAEASGKNPIFVGLTNTAVSVSSFPISSPTTPVHLHPLQNIIAACYAAGAILPEWFGGLPHVRAADPFIARFDVLGATRPLIDSTINLDDTVLVGAGAVANGF